ncbi:MAG: hypothetical protein ATN35_12930 [Epulopiscium sp. Nele67-Bin004]|nr:MAG: hypothetical protein ATN35_12930 [Epulopiscium sp. Nele67-Bin004]
MNEIFTRRTVRQFSDEPVKDADVEQLLRAAMQAPSAKNQQCWEFIVTSKKEDLTKLSQTHPGGRPVENSQVAIIVIGNTDRMTMADRYEHDLGAVSQNILLQATTLGLGSVWCGVAPSEERMNIVREIYNLPENLLIFSVIGIGHPKAEDALKFIDRYDESRVTFIK